MSVHVMTEAWNEATVTGNAFVVLLKLADNADDERRLAWPSVPHLAAKCRISERTVQRVLKELVEAGEVTVHREATSRRATVYRVHPGQGRQSVTPAADDAPGVTPVSPSTVLEPPSPNGHTKPSASRPSLPVGESPAGRPCRVMSEMLRERYADGPKSKQHTVVKAWVTAGMAIMREHDIGPERLEEVVVWVCRHGFWGSRVQSMTRLRQEWESVVNEMNGHGRTNGRDGLRRMTPGEERAMERQAMIERLKNEPARVD